MTGIKLTIEEFIQRSQLIHNNKYNYSKFIYTGMKNIGIIICPIHGEFLQYACNHLQGHSCKKCALELIEKQRPTNISNVIYKAQLKHGNLYDYSKVNYKNFHRKEIIICKIHGEFLQSFGRHLKGRGCPRCGGTTKSNTVEFIDKSNKIHGHKYDYSLTDYKTNRLKVSIICPIHGTFYQCPDSHLKGSGCKSCNNLKIISKDQFVEKSNIIHNNKYNYSKLSIKDYNTKGIIICPKHGEFIQRINNHLKGRGCKKCYIDKRLMTIEEFINRSNIIHKNLYDYSKVVYKKSNKKVIIICPFHGDFFQTPRSHLTGSKCNRCIKKISEMEKEFLNYMNIPDKQENRQVKILRKLVDGYDPETKTVYEYLGDYWHGNPERFNKDNLNKHVKKTFGELYNEIFKKFNILKSLGYNIKYIWETDWMKFKDNKDKEPNILTY